MVDKVVPVDDTELVKMMQMSAEERRAHCDKKLAELEGEK